MKKLIGFMLASAMLLTACSSQPASTPAADGAKLTPGTYTGTATGFHGDITVEVEVDETSILNVVVTDHIETRFISDDAINKLPADIVENQSVAVDMYSGCTVTSYAVTAAVKDALKQAGGLDGFTTAPEKPEVVDVELETDVLVIGGGMGGLSSAIKAAEQGAKVVLVEKLGRVGGSTIISGGILYATGAEKNKALDNDVKALADYWQMRAEGNGDYDMITLAASKSGATIDQLVEWGVVLSDTIGATGTSPASRAMYASNKEAAGASTDGVDFIVPLYEKAKELGVEIYLGTKATELCTADGAVCGALAESKTANYTIKAKSVILATGGFDLDQSKMAKYCPDIAGEWAVSSPGNTGDGLDMAMAIGAKTDFTGGVIGFKIINKAKHYIEGENMLGWLGLLGVTDKGVRFGDESADYPIFCTELIEAKKAGAEKFFLIADGTNDYYAGLCELAVADGCGFKADSLEELAKAAGIDADTLAATVAEYNGYTDNGVADPMGKAALTTVKEGPFYAVRIFPATLGTMGGLVINDKAEVLAEDGSPIANLFATGEICNSWLLYKEYPASGTSICTTAVFGIIAADSAVANIG